MDRKKFHNVYARADDNVKHRRETVDNLLDPEDEFFGKLGLADDDACKESSENKFAPERSLKSTRSRIKMMITRVARWSTPRRFC